MRLSTAFVCLCAIVGLSVSARADTFVDMGAIVTKVDAKTQRVTIDRGKAAGLRLGDLGELFPMVPGVPPQKQVVSFDLRLARGKIIELQDQTAVLGLEAINDAVEVGAFFGRQVKVPDALAQSALFRALALHIELQAVYEDKVYITVESMLADPSVSLRDKALDAMIAEMKSLRDKIKLFNTVVGVGRHRGKRLEEVVDVLSREELLDFFVFLESFPANYVGQRWRLAEIYLTWVQGGTPSGQAERTLKAIGPTIAAANAAAAGGKLDDARVQWQAVLRVIADHKEASEGIDRIDGINMLLRQLKGDPDNTAGRSDLVARLMKVSAYALATQHNERLAKQGYDPARVESTRGLLLARQRKWREAEKVYQRRLKQRPGDASLVSWLAYIRVEQRLEKSPDDPTARLALAAQHEADKSWDRAVAEYRRAVQAKGVTAKQREQAKLAQQRIGLRKSLESKTQSARDSIAQHEGATTWQRIDDAVAAAEKIDAATAGVVLGELAEAAGLASESDLALALLTQLTTRRKDDPNAHSSLAFRLLRAERIDEAEAAAKISLRLDANHAYAHLLLSYIARARNDLTGAEKLATKALTLDTKYAPPMLVLARVEAARGSWQVAADHARTALALQNGIDGRDVLTASLRGLQAHEALQVDPTSARERLRLVRSLADLGLTKRAAEELMKLPASGPWRADGWWSLAVSADAQMMSSDQLTAARNAQPVSLARKRVLAELEAQVRLRANPKDDATRLVLAKLTLQDGFANRSLAVIGPLVTTPMSPAVSAIVNDARDFITVGDDIARARAMAYQDDFIGATKVLLAYQAVQDRIGNTLSRMAAREGRMSVLAQQGRYDEAITLGIEARAIAVSEGDPFMIMVGDQHIARLKAAIGTSDAYRKALLDGVALCEGLDHERCAQGAHSELATLNLDDGRLAEALDHARRAWNLSDRQSDAATARSIRFTVANINLSAGRAADADETALKLLADCRKEGDITNEQNALLILGAVAVMRGDGKLARERFHEVYEFGVRIGQTRARAVARRLEGRAWLEADHNPNEAAIAFAQAAALLEPLTESWALDVRAGTLRELGNAHLQAGKVADARRAAEQALTLDQRFQRPPDLASIHSLLAKIALAEKNADRALLEAQEALKYGKQTDDNGTLATAWHVLARAHALKKQDQEALDAYEKSLEYMGRELQAAGGESGRDGFMNTGETRDMYADAVEHLLKLGKTARAMEVLEVSRDAQLKQGFDATSVQTKDVKLRARLDRYEAARARVNGLEKQRVEAMNKPAIQRSAKQVKAIDAEIAKTREDLREVALDLKVTHGHLYRALALNPETFTDRRKDLPKDSVLVMYFIAEDALYAFILSAALTQPAVVRVKVTSAELATAVADFRKALIQEGEKIKARDEVEALGRKLGDWLLAPVRTYIAGASTVIILPFGTLYNVPFDGLVVSPPGQPVRYAVEDYRISIQTASTLEYLLKPGRPRSTGKLLAISNPDGSLDGAQQEVNGIVKTMKDARVLGRKQATVKTFTELVGGFRYVHIATHGILETDPRKSHLKFSDGPLTLKAIARLGLGQSNELVVLSACDTATELRESEGEEPVSLADAFSLAGAPALVASLWEVDDDSTAELMSTFYRALSQGGGDPLDALRNAKLNLLRMKRGKAAPYAAPWHWASFQLYGDYRTP